MPHELASDGDGGDDDPIKRGTRVICRKLGPHKNKRGSVVAILGESLQVEFRTSTLVEKRTYFEPVHAEG